MLIVHLVVQDQDINESKHLPTCGNPSNYYHTYCHKPVIMVFYFNRNESFLYYWNLYFYTKNTDANFFHIDEIPFVKKFVPSTCECFDVQQDWYLYNKDISTCTS